MDPTTYQSHLQHQHNHWWFNARQEIIETFFAPFENEIRGGAILDIGSGGGRILDYLSRLGHIRALDKEPTVVEHIEKNRGPNIGKLGHLPDAVDFPAGSFCLITAFDVLEHVKEDQESLVRIGELLEPGGLCLLTVPAYDRFWSYHDDSSHHLRRYGPGELTQKLKAAGLKIERMTFFNTFLLIPILIVRYLKKKLSIGSKNIRNDMDLTFGKGGWLLELIFRCEKYWIRRAKLPMGLSIAVVGRKI